MFVSFGECLFFFGVVFFWGGTGGCFFGEGVFLGEFFLFLWEGCVFFFWGGVCVFFFWRGVFFFRRGEQTTFGQANLVSAQSVQNPSFVTLNLQYGSDLV